MSSRPFNKASKCLNMYHLMCSPDPLPPTLCACTGICIHSSREFLSLPSLYLFQLSSLSLSLFLSLSFSPAHSLSLSLSLSCLLALSGGQGGSFPSIFLIGSTYSLAYCAVGDLCVHLCVSLGVG